MSSEKCEDVQLSRWKFWMKRRYMTAILTMLGFFNIYALRINLSIAIVAMTQNKSHTLDDNNTIIYKPEFDWSSEIQGYILSSFFYGYITTQLLGGWLGAKIGGKRVFGIAVGMTSFLTLLTPVVSKVSVFLLIAVRVIMGVFEGVSYPAIHALWSKWAPPLERGRLSGIGLSGSYIGNVVAMPLSAYLAESVGWESIFYVFGAFGLVWFVLWWIFVADTPVQDKRITPEERDYIVACIKGNGDENEVTSHPWKGILTSIPFWACVVVNFCENWGVVTMVTLLPKFMKEVLDFDLAKAGFMSALPYLTVYITIQGAGYLGDWLVMNNYMKVTNVRKLLNCGAFISQAVFMMIGVYWLDPIGTTLCITAGIGLGGFALTGCIVNYLDLAPKHASVLFGIGNTFGTIPGIVSPIIAGYIVTTPTVDEWRIIFYIASGVYLFGAIFYAIFASGEVQPWANDSNREHCQSKEEFHDNYALKRE